MVGRRLPLIQPSTAAVRVQAASQATLPDTRSAARRSIRSTVSPALRHGLPSIASSTCRPRSRHRPARSRASADRSRARGRRRARAAATGPRAAPPSAARARSRPAGRCSCAAGGARPNTCRPSRICISFRSQRCASSARSASVTGASRASARSRSSRCAVHQRDHVARHIRRALRIEVGGERVFVDQALQPRQLAVQLGAGQRRRQMVDDHGGGAALRLDALARIVDDERIEMRHAPEDRLGQARGRQAGALARQPFEIAVLAEMDHGVASNTPRRQR